MTRLVNMTTKVDKKKVDELTLEKKFAYAAILEGQVVSLGATDGVVIPCTNLTIPYGVACNGVTAALIADYVAKTKGTDSIEVVVAMEGFVPVLGGSALDANMWVSVDANGRVIQAIPATEEIIGFTASACAGDGETCTIFIHRIPAADYTRSQ